MSSLLTTGVLSQERTAPEFIIRVKTDNSGTSGNTQFTIPVRTDVTYNYSVVTDEHNLNNLTSSTTLTFSSAGEYDIKISGTFPSIYFARGGDRLKLLEIKNWGDVVWLIGASSFDGCNYVDITAVDAPKFDKSCVNISAMFRDCWNITSPNLNRWDVKNIYFFNSTFNHCHNFTGDISLWDMSNAQGINGMFFAAFIFNGDIGNWDVGNVSDFGNIFVRADLFNKPLNNWDVSSGQNMTGFFYAAYSFNQDISSWDTWYTTNMVNMFRDNSVFNRDLSSWCVEKIPSEPSNFDTGATSWVLPKPNWGASCATYQLPQDGLILHLDSTNASSYPGSGTTWYDLSGNGNHATINGPRYTTQAGDSRLNYTLVNYSGGHPTNTSGLTNVFNVGTNVATGIHIGKVSWASGNVTTRWGDLTSTYPLYHTRREYYGWKAEGYIYLPETGNYQFLIDGDDACDFFIDGQLCSYWYGGHGFGTGATGTTKYFTSGWYTFEVRMEEQTGGDGVSVGWKKPSDSAYHTIPSIAFSTYVPTSGDGYFEFDGYNDIMTIPGDDFSLQNYTILMWTYSGTYDKQACLFEKTTNGSLNTQYSIYAERTGNPSVGAVFVQRTMTTDPQDYSIAQVSTSTTDGQWNLIAYTINKGTKRIHYLWTQRDSFSTNFGGNLVENTTGDVYIGRFNIPNAYPFDGRISRVLVYNRALTRGQLVRYYEETKGDFGL